MAAAPSPSEWARRNAPDAARLINHHRNVVAAKLMLGDGRARELTAAYDGPTGLLGMKRGEPLNVCQLRDVPLVVLALRDVSRREEAAALLGRAAALVRSAYAKGRVPGRYEDVAAGVWAVQGNGDLAVDALERAQRRGWFHSGPSDILPLENEPALRSLRGNPRFEKLKATRAAHFAREKAQAARLGV